MSIRVNYLYCYAPVSNYYPQFCTCFGVNKSSLKVHRYTHMTHTHTTHTTHTHTTHTHMTHANTDVIYIRKFETVTAIWKGNNLFALLEAKVQISSLWPRWVNILSYVCVWLRVSAASTISVSNPFSLFHKHMHCYQNALVDTSTQSWTLVRRGSNKADWG